MKLYNKTKCPDSILKPLLIAAGKSVGARTGKVVVKVTQSQSSRTNGMAHRGMPYIWHLQKKRIKSNRTGKLILSDGGWFKISLPTNHSDPNWCQTYAKNFFETAQHEWSHIRDYQQNTYYPSLRQPNGRRLPWGERQEELQACAFVEDAKRPKNKKWLIQMLTLYLIR